MTDALLRVMGLKKSFGAVQATNNFALDVAGGEIQCVDRSERCR